MATVVLTEEQKVKVRHHMGYPNVAQAATFALGAVASVETAFMIERAMDKILPASLPELERLLAICDQCESQSVGDMELMAVNQVGEISVNQEEQRQIDRRYDRWVAALANFLTVPRNPFDARLAVGGINARVMR